MPSQELKNAALHTANMLARAKIAKERSILASDYAHGSYNAIIEKFKLCPEEVRKQHAVALKAAEQATCMLDLIMQADELTKEANRNNDLQRALYEVKRATNAIEHAESAATIAERARDLITCSEISTEKIKLHSVLQHRCVIS